MKGVLPFTCYLFACNAARLGLYQGAAARGYTKNPDGSVSSLKTLGIATLSGGVGGVVCSPFFLVRYFVFESFKSLYHQQIRSVLLLHVLISDGNWQSRDPEHFSTELNPGTGNCNPGWDFGIEISGFRRIFGEIYKLSVSANITITSFDQNMHVYLVFRKLFLFGNFIDFPTNS
jgi:hypothetical protein